MYGEEILDHLKEAENVLQDYIGNKKNIAKIEAAAEYLAKSINKGGKIISCGNGGSHCDAMHFAEELTGNYREQRRPLPAIAISDPSHISCVGNDYGYEAIFSRYIEGLGKMDDCLLAISCSGNSPNIVNAANQAKKLGMRVIALTGKDGGELGKLADVELRVPYKGYADRIQEVHIKIIHILIFLIEKMVK